MQALKVFLILVAVASGLACMFLFFWWVLMIGGLLFSAGFSSPVDDAIAAYRAGNFPLLMHIVREYFAAIAGCIGWAALFALCILARRNWESLPKWIPIGCALGAVAVLIGPYAYVLAIPPITLAATVLLLIKLRPSEPAGPGNATELSAPLR